MFAFISQLLGKDLSPSEVASHDAYLASSADLADLERRMRRIDEEDHAYSLSFCGAISRDHSAFAATH